MMTRMLATLVIGLGTLQGAAMAHDDNSASRRAPRPAPQVSGEQIAINACLAGVDDTEYGPATLVEVVEDGMDDLLVWMADAEDYLWICNASTEGHVFFNMWIEGDLLEGLGQEFVSGIQPVRSRGRQADPANIAEQLCMAVLETVFETDTTGMLSVEDGLGDYLVWLAGDDDSLWACNASSDGLLFMFEPVDTPIYHYNPGYQT